MTRKDYILIAQAISNSRYMHILSMRPEYQAGIDRTTQIIANFLQSENPRFDMNRFLSAAEYGKMPRESEVA